ncbi:MAG: DUF4340 domain-containing protein [Saprospirales bacterium]|nr:DUF4340 domain-containing protein [Saprospirales bacterium]
MKRSTLILLFFLIALLFWGVRYFSQHRDPIFETQLIAIDTAAVTMLSFSPGEAPDREVLAKREGKTWIASLENRAVKAPFSTMDSLLASLVRIESHHIVGKGPDVWAACGLEPGEGTRIRIFQNEKLLEDFIIGRYDPIQDGEGYTYIRLSDDESVFAVQGNLKSKLWPGFEAFRSKNFLELDPLKIQEIRWEPSGEDSALVFHRQDTGWVFPGNALGMGPQLDSFLRHIQGLQGTAFADAFDPVSNAQLLEGRITFFATDWEAPVEVSYYRDSTEVKAFIFYSTCNPDNFFGSDSSELFQVLVRPFYSFSDFPQSDSTSH